MKMEKRYYDDGKVRFLGIPIGYIILSIIIIIVIGIGAYLLYDNISSNDISIESTAQTDKLATIDEVKEEFNYTGTQESEEEILSKAKNPREKGVYRLIFSEVKLSQAIELYEQGEDEQASESLRLYTNQLNGAGGIHDASDDVIKTMQKHANIIENSSLSDDLKVKIKGWAYDAAMMALGLNYEKRFEFSMQVINSEIDNPKAKMLVLTYVNSLREVLHSEYGESNKNLIEEELNNVISKINLKSKTEQKDYEMVLMELNNLKEEVNSN